MHVAITSNGPGEFSGWVRPLVSALYRLAPQTEVTIFFVPDDYATGREPAVAAALFPRARVVPAPSYVRFALGRAIANAPPRADVVQYLGGDLMHAARVRARLGGAASTYKFARKGTAPSLARAFAIDAKNAAEMRFAGTATERIEIVGNLAIDGALGEAAGDFGDAAGATLAPAGVLIMPGTRKHEVANMVPFFLAVALRLRALRPDLPIGFAISPFTLPGELERALASGGHRNIWGARGRVATAADGALAIEAAAGGAPFAVVRDAMRSAACARLAITLPGTKCIELAALGVPTIVCAPANAPEVVVINGPLQYLDRIPLAGIPLKRAIVTQVDRRFALVAQPNIDLGAMVMPELRGALIAGDVARRAAAYADDAAGRECDARRLRALYAEHAGAAERMARSILAVAAA